jgi:branched-chain amino acid transport system substrate-binding protein
MKKSLWIVLAIILIILIIGIVYFNNSKSNTVKVGWISDLSGSTSKWQAYEAASLAVDDINSAGGINGKKLELIVEDGKCDAKTAVDAVNKLIYVDKMKIILGGHCSAESVAIAPIAEKNKVIMLASITSNPYLTTMGDYVFRTTSVSTAQAPVMSEYAYKNLTLRKMAIITAQADYPRPIAQKMKEEFTKLGGKVVLYEEFDTKTTDFRDILTKIKNSQADSVFLSVAAPDSSLNFMKQAKEIGLNVTYLGNEGAGTPAIVEKNPDLYEGFIMAYPDFDLNDPKTKDMVDRFRQRYNSSLGYGIWTAETYDTVFITRDMIVKCGEVDTDCMKNFLYGIKDYHGVSGNITIDSNGDGVRVYTLKVVKNGNPVRI